MFWSGHCSLPETCRATSRLTILKSWGVWYAFTENLFAGTTWRSWFFLESLWVCLTSVLYGYNGCSYMSIWSKIDFFEFLLLRKFFKLSRRCFCKKMSGNNEITFFWGQSSAASFVIFSAHLFLLIGLMDLFFWQYRRSNLSLTMPKISNGRKFFATKKQHKILIFSEGNWYFRRFQRIKTWEFYQCLIFGWRKRNWLFRFVDRNLRTLSGTAVRNLCVEFQKNFTSYVNCIRTKATKCLILLIPVHLCLHKTRVRFGDFSWFLFDYFLAENIGRTFFLEA